MSDLTPARARSSVPLTRRQVRAVEATQFSTSMQVAQVRSRAIVQAEKMTEIDRLTEHAMAGQAMLSRWRTVLAQGDPFLEDELKFFTDVARLGKGEIIADTIQDFSRGRR
jgi:hypothetical protein